MQVGSGVRMGSADLICADKRGALPMNGLKGTKPQVQTCAEQLGQPALGSSAKMGSAGVSLCVCVHK